MREYLDDWARTLISASVGETHCAARNARARAAAAAAVAAAAAAAAGLVVAPNEASE